MKTKGFIGLLIRLGGATICGFLLTKISVGTQTSCNCAGIFLFHLVFSIIAIIVDHVDTKPDGTHPVLKALSLAIGFVLSAISMNFGHIVCSGFLFLTSCASVALAIYTENKY